MSLRSDDLNYSAQNAPDFDEGQGHAPLSSQAQANIRGPAGIFTTDAYRRLIVDIEVLDAIVDIEAFCKFTGRSELDTNQLMHAEE
jgi:hypothetical protein